MLMRVNYQVIFTLGTKNLGRHTKRGSGLIVMVRSYAGPTGASGYCCCGKV